MILTYCCSSYKWWEYPRNVAAFSSSYVKLISNVGFETGPATWIFHLFGTIPFHFDTVWFCVFCFALQSSLVPHFQFTYLKWQLLQLLILKAHSPLHWSFLPTVWMPVLGTMASHLVSLKDQQLEVFCAISELYAVFIATANPARRKKSKWNMPGKTNKRFRGDPTTKWQDFPNYALKLTCLINFLVTGRLLERGSH